MTVLFTDVVDSTALGRRLEVERLSRVLERFFDVAREVMDRHDGAVQKYLGDAVMAVFGLPHVHVDDPLRAVKAAMELHARVRDLNAELHRDWGVELTLHTAISSGEVMVEEGETWELGVAADHVNLVAGLIKLAGPDAVLIANATYQLVRGSVRAEPVHAPALGRDGPVFNVLELSEQAPPRLMVPMIGRDWELRYLDLSYDGVLERRSCYLMNVLGPPGIGKTRLVEEFVRGLSRRKDLSERPQVLRGQCLRPAGDSTFYPMRQMIRQAAGIRADALVADALHQLSRLVDGNQPVVARLAPFIGLPGQAAEPEDTVRAICRALAAAATRTPLVLAVDDLHWAEQPMLDILERVKDWLTDVPALVIAISREEFLDEKRDWAGWMRNTGSITLEPLKPSQTEQMIGQILLGGEPDPQVVTTIVEETGGSPLDVEALMRNILDDGLLRLEEGRWVLTGDLGTLRTMLKGETAFAARIERLDEDERRLIVRAAVVGPQFRVTDVTALVPELDRVAVAAALGSLVRKELLKPAPDAGPFEPGDDSYSFRHARYQQTAYDRLPLEDRAALHERYANHLDASGESTPTTAERIAFHLKQSHDDLVELRGSGAARADELARRAGQWYAHAGRGYITQGAFPVPYADRAFTRAVRLLPDGSPEQLQAWLDLADTVQEPDPERARRIYVEVAQTAQQIDSRLIEYHANFGRLEMAWFLKSSFVDPSEILQNVRKAVDEFESVGHDGGSEKPGPHLGAKAYRLLAHALWATGQIKKSLAAVERAISLVAQTGDARLHAKIVRMRCAILYWGPTPLESVAREVQEAVDWARREGLSSLEAAGLNLQARVAAMQGDFRRARQLNHDARQIKASRPDLLTHALDVISDGMVEALAGNLEDAERVLRAGYEGQRDREVSSRSTVAALLARVLLQSGRNEEAERYIEVCRNESMEWQLDSQLKWRQFRAVFLARRGEFAEAEKLAWDAVERSKASEQPLSRAEALADLADVLSAAGKAAEARSAANDALQLYRQKGHRVAAEDIQRRFLSIPMASS